MHVKVIFLHSIKAFTLLYIVMSWRISLSPLEIVDIFTLIWRCWGLLPRAVLSIASVVYEGGFLVRVTFSSASACWSSSSDVSRERGTFSSVVWEKRKKKIYIMKSFLRYLFVQSFHLYLKFEKNWILCKSSYISVIKIAVKLIYYIDSLHAKWDISSIDLLSFWWLW